MYSAGVAFLDVVGSFKGIQRDFEDQAAKLGKAVDKSIADAIPQGVKEGTRRAQREMEDGGKRTGEKWGGSFVRGVRDEVRKAAATISDIPVGVETSEAKRELDGLRARLAALSDVRIGVDMPLEQFLAESAAVEAALERLDGRDIEIQTRLEAAAARAGLTALHQQINAIDRDDIEVDVDVAGSISGLRQLGETAGVSMGRMGLLASLGGSIGTAIVPAAAVAVASISAIATAASAAALGVGVLALGLLGPLKAVAALDKFQKSADKSAHSLSASQSAVAGALDQVRGAAAGVRSAERNLTQAQKDATDAVKDLVKAREDARRQLEDMTQSVKSNALAQRQAKLDEVEAREALNKVLANPRATDAEREQARITHEERVLQIEDLGIRQKRLVADEAVGRAKGVEGSDQVRAAQAKIVSTIERVADAQESVASSQRSLAAANRALQQSYEKTGVAGGEAFRTLQDAMDQLSPAGRRFALFLFSLKDEFKGLQAAAETGLLPGLEEGIRNLLPVLAPLKKLIGEVAVALGESFVAFTQSLKEPIWREFFGYLGQTAVPVLKGMAVFFGNIAKGVAGVLLGLSGFNGPIGNGILAWSEDFARWGTTLDSNAGWKNFIQYIKDAWPSVRDFFANLWEFTKKFVIAAAPIGLIVVAAFAKLFEWLDKLDSGTWTIIIGAIAGVAAALLLVAGATAIITTGWAGLIIGAVALVATGFALLYKNFAPFRTVVDATLHAVAVVWQWLWSEILKPGFEAIKVGVVALAGAWMWMWDHVGSKVLPALGAAFGVLMAAFKPAADLIRTGVQAIGAVFVWLWEHVGVHVFDSLKTAFGVLTAVFQTGAKIIGAVFTWLWEHIGVRIFGALKVAFDVLYAVFQVMVGLFQIAIKILVAGFDWMWEHVGVHIFGLFKAAFGFLWSGFQAMVGWFTTGLKILGALFVNFYVVFIQPWVDKLKGIFTWLSEVIQKYVAPGFKIGLEALGKAWDVFVNALKVPVKFIINTVLNEGILKGYNKLADMFNVNPKNVHIDLPAGFAAGGAIGGRGTGTSDSNLALVSKGEHIWTAAEVAAAGGHGMVYALRRMVLNGALPAFAAGGAIGGSGGNVDSGDDSWLDKLKAKASGVFDGVTDLLTNPGGALKALADKLIQLVPGRGNAMIDALIGFPATIVGSLIDKVKGLSGFAGGALGGGAAGPGGAGPGFLPWPGSPGGQRGDSGVWHNILGLVRASGIPYSFGNSYRPGDPKWHGSGRAIDFMGYQQDALANFFLSMQPRVLELIHRTNARDYGITRGRTSGMPTQWPLHKNHLHVAMDSGGMLQPGWNPPIWNGTGEVEPVLNPKQWRDINVLASNGGGGQGASYNFAFRDTTLDPSKLRALQDREAALARIGRAR